jgi:entericidin B
MPPSPAATTTDSINYIQKEHNMKKVTAVLVIVMLGFLAGCNTMEGMGKDIERGGEKLQNSSQDTKEKM